MDNVSPPYASCIPEVDQVVEKLCQTESLSKVWREASSGKTMPSLAALKEIMERLRAIIFPGYFGRSVSARSIKYHLASNLDSVYHLLVEQITRGFCFASPGLALAEQKKIADTASLVLLDSLPQIRDLLVGDAQAGYEGDPAATSPAETIFCYKIVA